MPNLLKISLTISIALLLVQSQFPNAHAQVTPPPIIPGSNEVELVLPHPTDETASTTYLQNQLLPGIAASIITITAGLSVVMMVYAGILMLTSYANPDNFKKGTSTMTWAIIGLIISGLSYAIVKIIASLSI